MRRMACVIALLLAATTLPQGTVSAAGAGAAVHNWTYEASASSLTTVDGVETYAGVGVGTGKMLINGVTYQDATTVVAFWGQTWWDRHGQHFFGGSGRGEATSFTIDSSLNGAAVVADIPWQWCTFDEIHGEQCWDGGPMPVTMTWTASGDMEAVTTQFNDVSRWFSIIEATRASRRLADAAGMIGTIEIGPMVPEWTDLARGSVLTVFVVPGLPSL